MAREPRRALLDRPLARVVAALVALACLAALVYLERERLWPGPVEQTAADDPFARCLAERAAEIDRMVEEELIEQAQAALFKSRAEAMCRATTAEGATGAPPLPRQ